MLNFKYMESIRLNEISGQEFGSFFKKLKWSQRSVFVREHRSEIEATSNADVLQCLCEFGYFNALYPLVAIDSNRAYAMFALASPCVIQKYLTKIGSLNGNHGFVTYGHLKNLAVRTDIDVEEKHELLLLTVNRLKVRTQTIHDLRVAGLLDF